MRHKVFEDVSLLLVVFALIFLQVVCKQAGGDPYLLKKAANLICLANTFIGLALAIWCFAQIKFKPANGKG